jgi:nitrite reductase/ring-hydroxylating ferredoxin subunit
MSELRKRVYTTPPGVKLVPVADIAEPGARSVVVQIGEAYFHGLLVHRDGVIRGYVDRCPHLGVPLARKLDDYLTPDANLIACSWHGALFRVEDGMCVGGPCAGGRLTQWPVTVVDGIVTTT